MTKPDLSRFAIGPTEAKLLPWIEYVRDITDAVARGEDPFYPAGTTPEPKTSLLAHPSANAGHPDATVKAAVEACGYLWCDLCKAEGLPHTWASQDHHDHAKGSCYGKRHVLWAEVQDDEYETDREC